MKSSLHIRSSDFYCESFEYQCGVNGFEKLLETHDKGRLPQAIICGNDNIAVGVCEAATAHGYQVPEDFCVTGFDNFDKAAYYEPRISTISHIRENVGIACVDLFLHIWKGGKTGPVLLYGYRRHFLGQLWLYAGRSAGSGRIFKRAGHVWN